MGPQVCFYFFTFFERTLYKSNYIIFILNWCGTHTKIRSKLVDIVTAGSPIITHWGPQRTPLGILRVKYDGNYTSATLVCFCGVATDLYFLVSCWGQNEAAGIQLACDLRLSPQWNWCCSSFGAKIYIETPYHSYNITPRQNFYHSWGLARKYMPKHRIIRKILRLVIIQKSYDICTSTYQPNYTASHLRRPIQRLRNHQWFLFHSL